MDLKIYLFYLALWISIFVTGNDRSEFGAEVQSEQTVLDSCYEASFLDVCLQSAEDEESEDNVIPLRRNAFLSACDETATCSDRCPRKSWAWETGSEACQCDCLFPERKDRCWKFCNRCMRFELSEYTRLECRAFDGTPSESVWTVGMCSSRWPVDEISKRCQNDFPDFLSRLPVLGKSGLAYKNAFCAHCNNDLHFDLWPFYAECQGPISNEVLNGALPVIFDYVLEFCDLRPATALDILHMLRLVKVGDAHSNTEDNTIRSLLNDFYSRLMRCLPNGNTSKSLALEDVLSSVHEEFVTFIDCIEILGTQNTEYGNSEDEFVSLGIEGDRYVYWNIPMDTNTVDAITKTMRKKRWTPPAFSLLFQFHEPNSKVVYADEYSSSSTTVSPLTSCGLGEVYDPFYKSCRAVLCTTNQTFTGISCSQPTPAVPEGRTVESVSRTVTLVVEIAPHDLPSNCNESVCIQAMYDSITTAVAATTKFNTTTPVNFTMTSDAVKYPDSNQKDHQAWDKENIVITYSFILVDTSRAPFTDNDIIEMANSLSSWIAFELFLLNYDYMSVMVVDSQRLHILPSKCKETEKQFIYFKDEYDIVDHAGQLWVYIPKTYKTYLESDVQFLDWVVTVNTNGTGRTYVDNSRVLVCDDEARNISSCYVFIPLNETEYDVLPDGDVYLTDRNVTVPKNEVAIIDGAVAICIDDYLLIQSNTSDAENKVGEEMSYDTWVEVAIWINFSLSMLSLISLLITFITYAIFEDLRTISGCCIMNLIVAQFCSMTMFLFVAGAELSDNACMAVAIMLHFLFLSAFFWNNVISFDVYRTFGLGLKNAVRRMAQNRRNSTVGNKTTHARKTVMKYMVYAWGTPCVIVLIAVALDLWVDSVHMGYEYDPSITICWISNPMANIVGFGVPVFVILIVNIVFFCLTICSIRQFEKSIKNPKEYRKKVPSVSDDIGSMGQTISPDIVNTDSVYEVPQEHERREEKQLSVIKFFKRKKNRRPSLSVHRTSSSRMRANVFTYLKMSVLMGFSWMIGFVAVCAKLLVLWFIFEVSISLQGVLILLAFIWKRRIRLRYKQLLSSLCCYQSESLPSDG